jgi:SAM-dependent methyltransferase
MSDLKRIKKMSKSVMKYVQPNSQILEIGGGKNRLNIPNQNIVQLDKQPITGNEVIHDLEITPLPFKDNTFDIVFSHAVLEHVANISKLFEDIHRILKPNGKLIAYVPHYAGLSAMHFLHRNYFSSDCMNFFSPNNPDFNFESKIKFKTVKRKITFAPIFKPVEFIINSNDTTRRIYEGTLCCFIVRPQMIFFVLEAIK